MPVCINHVYSAEADQPTLIQTGQSSMHAICLSKIMSLRFDSGVCVIQSMEQKKVVICGTRYAGEIKEINLLCDEL